MATKRTKPESPVAKAAKPAPKRKVAVGPAPAEARTVKPVAIPTLKPMTPAAPKTKLAGTRKLARQPAIEAVEKPKAASLAEFTTEMVALRAYFIGERRQANGEPGDSTTDWLEAEQQLRGEREA